METRALLPTASLCLLAACAHAPPAAVPAKSVEPAAAKAVEPDATKTVDPAGIAKDLAAAGAEGWVHGAVPARGLYVFTVRNPKDFFDYVDMSLTTRSPDVAAVLKTLSRHDKVRIKGAFLPNASPQKHIEATSIEMVRKYKNGYAPPGYTHGASIPAELADKDHARFLVHAVNAGGHILVVEYRDAVLPIFVHDAARTAALYRNDVVELKYRLQGNPQQPLHLKLDEAASDAVKVIESIKERHGKPAQVEGPLVLFPKAPGIMFNVFAVQDAVEGNLMRQFTLVNFDDRAAFAKIREKLQAAWDRHPDAFVNGRNKLVSTKVRVRVTGTFNEVDPNQANAQILLESPDQITVVE